MIDIHNHALFGVDDGAVDLTTSLAMIEESIKHGIKTIYLTPHVNATASKAPRALHHQHFQILQKAAKHLPISLVLWAEVYIGQKLPQLDWKDLVVHQNYVLVEFSPIVESPIVDLCYNLTKKGFNVVLAHVERYGYLTLDDLMELEEMGIILQVNTSSILNKGKWFHHLRAKKYAKNNLIHVYASDYHRLSQSAKVYPSNFSFK
jgi:protein-tyrosine phosphatase